MAEWEKGENLVGFANRVGTVEGSGGPDEVSVREHRPFRRACRAGGVDEERRIVRIPFFHLFGEPSRIFHVSFNAHFQEFLESNDTGILKIPEALPVDDDDLLQGGRFLPRFQSFVELFLVLDEEEARPAMIYHVRHLFRGIGCIHCRGDSVGGLDAQIDEEPFRTVLADDGHALTPVHTQRDEAHGHTPCVITVIVPRDVVPDSELLLPHRGSVAVMRRPMHEQSW